MQFALIDAETGEAILKNIKLAIPRIIAVTLKFHRKQLSPVFVHKNFKVSEVYITYFSPHLWYTISLLIGVKANSIGGNLAGTGN